MADKRELILDLLARDKTGPASKSASKNLGDLGTAADKAGEKTQGFGKKAKDADDKAAALGKQAGETGRDMDKLTGEIALVERELESLARSFARTDDAAERLDISKAIRRMQNDLRRLNTSKGILSKIIPDPTPEEGQAWGKKFMGSLAAGLKGAGDGIASAVGSKPGITIGAALGAAAAPVLVSTMASAISAGAGAGFLGAGIALAVKGDKNIQAAGAQMGKQFVDGLTKSATTNFSGPIRQSLGILGDAADRVVKKWDGTFKALGSSVVPLTRNIVQGVEDINDAVADVAADSGPALDGLGDSFRLISSGVADFVRIVADGGPQAADNLKLVAGATADVLRYSGLVLKTFNDIANNAWLTGPLLPLLKRHYSDAADASDDLKGSTEEAAASMDTAARAANGEREALTLLAKELKGQTDPVFGLLNAQDRLAEAQDKAADSTKKHGRNSKETKAALRDLALAAIDMEDKAGALGQTFDGKMTPALRNTLKAAGATDREIDGLERQFRDAKKAGDGFAKRYTASVAANNVGKVKNSLYSVRDAANSIPRAVTISMRITGTKNVSAAAASVRKQYDARATGGSVREGTPTWVGENGAELLYLDRPARVLSASASRGITNQGTVGQASTGMPTALRLELAGPEEVKTMFRYLVRTANLIQ
jgi:hypothetical protein